MTKDTNTHLLTHLLTHSLTHSILERARINIRRRGYGRKSGVVKMWNNQRGFGFIKQNDAGNDVFCHVTDINDGNALRAGDSVRLYLAYPSSLLHNCVMICLKAPCVSIRFTLRNDDRRPDRYRATGVTGGVTVDRY